MFGCYYHTLFDTASQRVFPFGLSSDRILYQNASNGRRCRRAAHLDDTKHDRSSESYALYLSKSARTPASSSCPDLISMAARDQRRRMSFGYHLVPPLPGRADSYRSLEMDDTDRARQKCRLNLK